ncbi:endonuclease [Segetibacter sp. 3557_3]|uniref:DNA-formamidopyrimidine glycosylase family protein n=1 Tax=Segetibacter sp. 3557_3 TaxID=2547429 RepID=UPI001058AE0F|nr:DNA-formamidopyrimidine glycosylase family protein [Segetibacter sp. 3557_3]TDH25115.1 endonuclease [Segetibacter sp. 3557_3]
MPEGPSIVILKELVQQFKGRTVIEVGGNTKVDISALPGQVITDFKSWGKNFLICFSGFTVKIHLMLFGTYRINEQRPVKPRISLLFENGELNFYACTVAVIPGKIDTAFDWEGDIMSDKWSPSKAKKKLKACPDALVCDVLLDQQIFAGVGNIIKNEVLFRIFVHPESRVGALPVKQLNALLREARAYSFDFLEWKKNFVLRKHWLAHTKKICPRCDIPLVKKYAGKTNRRSYFCINCQVLYE